VTFRCVLRTRAYCSFLFLFRTAEGDAFEVRDIEALETSVLGQKYFETTKYSSFRKQMNNYQFEHFQRQSLRRDVAATRIEIFRHKHFRRGQSDLLKLITKRSNDKFKCNEEVDALKTRLLVLEEAHNNLRKAMASLEKTNIERMTYIGRLQHQDASKNSVILAMEVRLRALEHRFSNIEQCGGLPLQGQVDAHYSTAAASQVNQFLARSISAIDMLPFVTVQKKPEAPMDSTDCYRQATLPPHPNAKRRTSDSNDVHMEHDPQTPAFRMDSMSWLKGVDFPHDATDL
jgi:HSF-type DNA-binding